MTDATKGGTPPPENRERRPAATGTAHLDEPEKDDMEELNDTTSPYPALPEAFSSEIEDLVAWAEKAGIPVVSIDRIPASGPWVAIEDFDEWTVWRKYSEAECDRLLDRAAAKSTVCLVHPYMHILAAVARDLAASGERVLIVERVHNLQWPFPRPRRPMW